MTAEVDVGYLEMLERNVGGEDCCAEESPSGCNYYVSGTCAVRRIGSNSWSFW
jgi:hypothetical protein